MWLNIELNAHRRRPLKFPWCIFLAQHVMSRCANCQSFLADTITKRREEKIITRKKERMFKISLSLAESTNALPKTCRILTWENLFYVEVFFYFDVKNMCKLLVFLVSKQLKGVRKIPTKKVLLFFLNSTAALQYHYKISTLQWYDIKKSPLVHYPVKTPLECSAGDLKNVNITKGVLL